MKDQFRFRGIAPARLVPAVAVALFAAACTDDSTGPESSALSDEEVAAIAVSADLSAGDGVSEGIVTNTSITTTDGTTTITLNHQRSCPNGGTAAIVGTLTGTRSDEELTATFDGTWTGQGCVVRSGLAVTGALDLDATRRYLRLEHSGAQSTSLEGSLAWTRANGESGTCAIDVSSTRSFASGTWTREVTGSVCGRTVDQTTTWTWDRD
jgi:hypothetical protein